MQAGAARAQAKAAEAQVLAANAEVATANLQLEASLHAAEAAVRPVMEFRLPEMEQIIDDPDWEMNCELKNRGLGPALDLEAFWGDDPEEAAGLYGDSLGVQGKKMIRFYFQRMHEHELTLRYRSTHGWLYETKLAYFPGFDSFSQSHKLVEGRGSTRR